MCNVVMPCQVHYMTHHNGPVYIWRVNLGVTASCQHNTLHGALADCSQEHKVQHIQCQQVVIWPSAMLWQLYRSSDQAAACTGFSACWHCLAMLFGTVGVALTKPWCDVFLLCPGAVTATVNLLRRRVQQGVGAWSSNVSAPKPLVA